MIRELPSVRSTLRRMMACLLAMLPFTASADEGEEAEGLWVLKPVVRPEVPPGKPVAKNPIDAFIAAGYEAGGRKPARQADRGTRHRPTPHDRGGWPPARGPRA